VHVVAPGADNMASVNLSESDKAWMQANSFSDASAGEAIVLPDNQGGIGKVVLVLDDPCDLWAFSKLRQQVPAGSYAVDFCGDVAASGSLSATSAAALGWMLGSYSFDRYKSNASESPKQDKLLVWPSDLSEDEKSKLVSMVEGIYLARDMVSTPAEEMAPQHIEMEARSLAKKHSASISCIIGDDLLKENYPAIHTVGRACTNEPRLIDIRWKHPAATKKITLVGKGVSFDTGGLDLKPAAAMKLMKKDMGGAALVMGLAHAIMATNLAVDLRVLVPAVENSVAGNAFRPLDVLQTRAGITVENGNTDAEGRLILCDALAEAASENPDMILDAATLTGAARVALGTEMPALFCTSDDASDKIIKISKEVKDFMWPMPLHAPYRAMINSKVADIGSCSEGGYAGAITAALFLKEFVKDYPGVWAHVDTMGYNVSSKPGRPEGGEALALRALYEFVSTF
jgi:leucyl aminopeptidase